MEAKTITNPGSAPVQLMNRMRFYYLDSESRRQVDDLLKGFIQTHAPQNLIEQLKNLLPIERRDPSSLRRYVEGMFYLSERLWSEALEVGKKTYGDDFSRQNLLRITKSLPMSHYRYLTGSREPMNVLLTRDDALQDPVTAMVKLGHDVEALSDFIQNTPAETLEVQ